MTQASNSIIYTCRHLFEAQSTWEAVNKIQIIGNGFNVVTLV